MGKSLRPEEGHERGCERMGMLVEGFQRAFATDGIMAKPTSSQANALFNRRKHAQASQSVRHHSHFSKPGGNGRNWLGGCLDGDFGMAATAHLSFQREEDNPPRLILSSDEVRLASGSMSDGNVFSRSRCQMILIIMDCEHRERGGMLQTRSA